MKMNVIEQDLSIPIDCVPWIKNSTSDPSFRAPTPSECQFSRVAGSILLSVAVVSFVFNIHSLFFSKKYQNLTQRDASLVIGMFVSSTCVIVISVPSVVTQCFLCRRLCSPSICFIEGFNSFFHGCAAMYMLVALSIVRFATTASSMVSVQMQRQMEKHSYYFLCLCFFMASIWAIPPSFGLLSAYVPEGLGFHCGLDWFKSSIPVRIYFFLLFFNVFLIPVMAVIYVNIFIHRTVYRLTHLRPSVMLELYPIRFEDNMRRHISHSLYNKELRRLHRLHEDRRFVVATGISIVTYLIAWTPYSVVALAQLFGDQFTVKNPWLMTSSALLAKISMITNPIIFMFFLKNENEASKSFFSVHL